MRFKFLLIFVTVAIVGACTHTAKNSNVHGDSGHRKPQNIGESHFESAAMMKEHEFKFRSIMDATLAQNTLNEADRRYLNEVVLKREVLASQDPQELDLIVKGLRMRTYIFRNMDYFNVAQAVINQFDQEIDRLTQARSKNPNSSGQSTLREQLSAKLRVLYAWREHSNEEMDFMYYHLIKASNEPHNPYYPAAQRILSKTVGTYKKECQQEKSMCLAIYSVMQGLREVEQEYLTFYPNGKVLKIADEFQWDEQQYNEFIAAQRSPSELSLRRQKEDAARFQRFLDKLWKEFQQSSRSPQADMALKPDPGPNGNTTGRAFDKGTWAITMDDGPHKVHTLSIENSFSSRGLKGTFFWLSQNIPKLNDVVNTVKAKGHDLASHSYSHANLPTLDQAGLNREIVQAADIFEKSIGAPPTLFRCPYGACKPGSTIRQMIAQRKMLHAFWTVDTLDWQDKNPQVIFERTRKQMELDGKGMVLFHDIHLQSAQAIELLLGWMQKSHPEWKTLPLSQIIRTQTGLKDFRSPAP